MEEVTQVDDGKTGIQGHGECAHRLAGKCPNCLYLHGTTAQDAARQVFAARPTKRQRRINALVAELTIE